MSTRQDWQSYGAGFLGPPSLSDKLADWGALADGGGDALIRDRDVLDVGPAYGVDAFVFSFYAKSYTVLDGYAKSLEQVARVAPRSTGKLCDLRGAWPIESSSFDLVIDFSTFDDSQDAPHCYREAARVLRQGGTLITSYANRASLGDHPHFETRWPGQLASLLLDLGLMPHHRSREDQPRAVMLATKGSP
jgi:SAM-dependent methyltransferase